MPFSILDELRALLLRRTEVRDAVWCDVTIAVDGYHFQNCRFERCRLTHRGDFALSHCTLIDCTFVSMLLAETVERA